MGICVSVRFDNGSLFRHVLGVVAQICLVRQKLQRASLAGGHADAQRLRALRRLRQYFGVVPGRICAGLRQVAWGEGSESICEWEQRKSAKRRIFYTDWPRNPFGGQVVDSTRQP